MSFYIILIQEIQIYQFYPTRTFGEAWFSHCTDKNFYSLKESLLFFEESKRLAKNVRLVLESEHPVNCDSLAHPSNASKMTPKRVVRPCYAGQNTRLNRSRHPISGLTASPNSVQPRRLTTLSDNPSLIYPFSV